MAEWTTAELADVGQADELRVASSRADGSLRPFVTIWVVRAGDDLYIRSAYGPENGWFRRALASGQGRIRAGGVEKDVTFEQVGAEVADAVDAAYHAKYDRYGPRIVNTVVGAGQELTTIRLLPREA
ncbi:conserved hypothetical protein [Beutenbergia cavernae DSM 12333]|uniref:DUF2255 family protein n=1 Tax=Beutenbergia cavernae (strain ATCC BAA-8 / DSM 12333 / CCUG 43141 / JCM 11478 / NBRC 16432 / NCIMB 13614 / HKI 0122) TaxID=471853 RepID=C5C607_BEUC1|nr:DUF2255 family protein [Beutenbergia cavernae]ACQ82365.1 conserved hypothetical protein [Beutenbergia cavernae DSM 12333]